MAEQNRTAVRVRISGRVQGVSYRAWVRDEARRRGLGGWVRNERDGTVTALFVGPGSETSTMIDALWTGPPGAAVDDVVSEVIELVTKPEDFRITV